MCVLWAVYQNSGTLPFYNMFSCEKGVYQNFDTLPYY